jgi:hypothetical protein
MPENFQHLGKVLIIAGALLLGAGLLLTFWGKLPFIGKLPGDIIIKKENFTFYFPIVTCIVISLLLTLIMSVFKK